MVSQDVLEERIMAALRATPGKHNAYSLAKEIGAAWITVRIHLSRLMGEGKVDFVDRENLIGGVSQYWRVRK